MNSSLQNLARVLGMMSAPNQTAKQKREIKRKVLCVPPRPMTEAEAAHYATHKNLSGFYK